MDTVFRSPTACRELLHKLAETREADLRSKWSPWKDQDPPPYGPTVKDQVPAEVRLLMAEAALAGERAGNQRLWRELYDLMGVPVMEKSTVELIWSIHGTMKRLNARIAELEGTATDGSTQGL